MTSGDMAYLCSDIGPGASCQEAWHRVWHGSLPADETSADESPNTYIDATGLTDRELACCAFQRVMEVCIDDCLDLMVVSGGSSGMPPAVSTLHQWHRRGEVTGALGRPDDDRQDFPSDGR